jgi:hypothetical protein
VAGEIEAPSHLSIAANATSPIFSNHRGPNSPVQGQDVRQHALLKTLKGVQMLRIFLALERLDMALAVLGVSTIQASY